jgi:hypothetical protein
MNGGTSLRAVGVIGGFADSNMSFSLFREQI